MPGQGSGMTKKQVIAQGRKFLQVLAGARDVFLRDGYAGAGVDEIARVSNVSKATLYAYFPDKQLMFAEVMRRELADLCATSPIQVSASSRADEALPRILSDIALWSLSPRAQDLHRVHLAEAGRFPELALGFQTAMNGKLLGPLEDQLHLWVRHGELSVADVPLAARQLTAMALAGRWGCLPDDRPTEEIRAQSEAAAQMFIRASRLGHVSAAAR
jgi:TetR/AcrR family transcriptional repressor of mexJK operon